MKKRNPLDMSKYLAKDTLIELCNETCETVRERIKYYYKSHHIKFDGTYSGECNRAALLFHIYFFKHLKDKQFEIMKNCTFGKDGRPEYQFVNMHNVQAICAADPLALSDVVIDFIHRISPCIVTLLPANLNGYGKIYRTTTYQPRNLDGSTLIVRTLNGIRICHKAH